jgi:AcrR family transcriptional regulator
MDRDEDGKVPARTRMPAAERRETILRAAAEVFAEAGYRAGKVSDVAARVGVTEPVIFQNFGSKAALFAAVLERAAAEVRASLDEMAAGAGSASGLLAHVLGPAAPARQAQSTAEPGGQPGGIGLAGAGLADGEHGGAGDASAGHGGAGQGGAGLAGAGDAGGGRAGAGDAGGGRAGAGYTDAGRGGAGHAGARDAGGGGIDAGLASVGHAGGGHVSVGRAGAAYGVLFADAAALAGEAELAGPARDAFRAVAAHLADLVRRAQADGGVRGDVDPGAAAWLLLSVLSARGLRAAAMPAGLEPAVAALALGALTPPGTHGAPG